MKSRSDVNSRKPNTAAAVPSSSVKLKTGLAEITDNRAGGLAQRQLSTSTTQRVPFQGEDTAQDTKVDIEEQIAGMDGFALGKLRGKIKAEINQDSGSPALALGVANNKKWMTAIDIALKEETARLKATASITPEDKDAFADLSATKSNKGATKRVFTSKDSKKAMATSKLLEPQEMLDEALKLEYMGKQGLNVPKAYLGGFDSYDPVSGMPQLNVPEQLPAEEAEASASASASSSAPKQEIKTAYAMDFIDAPKGHWYDLWKEFGKFQKDFIKSRPEFSTPEKLVPELRRIGAFLNNHIVVDLQIAVLVSGDIQVIDPVRIFQLDDTDDVLFLKNNENILSAWEQSKSMIDQAISNLTSADQGTDTWLPKAEFDKVGNMMEKNQPARLQALYAEKVEGGKITVEIVLQAIAGFANADECDTTDTEFLEALNALQ